MSYDFYQKKVQKKFGGKEKVRNFALTKTEECFSLVTTIIELLQEIEM